MVPHAETMLAVGSSRTALISSPRSLSEPGPSTGILRHASFKGLRDEADEAGVFAI
jgi:hypothetical protein